MVGRAQGAGVGGGLRAGVAQQATDGMRRAVSAQCRCHLCPRPVERRLRSRQRATLAQPMEYGRDHSTSAGRGSKRGDTPCVGPAFSRSVRFGEVSRGDRVLFFACGRRRPRLRRLRRRRPQLRSRPRQRREQRRLWHPGERGPVAGWPSGGGRRRARSSGALCRTHDVLPQPARREGLGNTLIATMMRAKPRRAKQRGEERRRETKREEERRRETRDEESQRGGE